MTREEPRPDRLPDIRQRLAYIGVWYGGDAASRVDIAWLVAEVEKLRGMLEMTERALQNTTTELGLIDGDDDEAVL